MYPRLKWAVTGIALDRTSDKVYTGKSIQLTAIISPSDATNTGVTWSSSDQSVAKVSSTGVVTGVATGTVTIIATAAGNTAFSASCNVTVSNRSVSVSGVSLSQSSLSLGVGGKKELTATVLPGNADERDVTWLSSNEKVATVDDGMITAVAVGQATITVETSDGGYTAVCTVTVTNEAIAVTGVTLNRTAVSLAKGSSFQLVANFSPEGASNMAVVWSSSAPGVVAVDTNGLLTAKNIGTSTITVLTSEGSFTAQCLVKVADSVEAFSDISGNWAKTYIESMVDAGFISGYTDGSFRPMANITRAEFISILIRILQSAKGETLQTGHVFNDTSAHWAKDYISTAVALSITSGYGNGNFGPNDPITREQIAVMLTKAADSSGSTTATSFTDVAKISSWAVSSVAYAAEQGWISGYSNGSFGPQRQATRAEVCALLWRFYQQING